jgi:hypothetical protein
MASALQLSSILYDLLLFTYPRDFRTRFGAEMITTFSDQISGEWECNGLRGVVRVWCSAAGEVFSVAIPLHLRSSIVVAMALSFLWASALFMALFRATSTPCGK